MAFSGDRLVIDSGTVNDFECSINFGPDSAEFVFVDEVSVHMNSDDASEHSWLVYFDKDFVDKNGKRYRAFDIGFRYRTLEGGKRTRDFHEMLSVGASYGFGYQENRFSPIYFGNETLRATIDHNDVVLKVEKTTETFSMFDDPPLTGYFWVLSNKKAPRKCQAEIKK